MAALTATLDTSDAFVSLTATGISGYTAITIQRIQPDGSFVNVRGTTGYQPGGTTTAAFQDYEGPLGVDFSYQLLGDGVVVATSGTINIPVSPGTYWLKNLSVTTMNVLVNVSKMGPVARPARILANSAVLGRKNPVVVTDVRGGRTGQMTLYSTDSAATSDLLNLLAGGGTLMFQAPYTYGFPDMYFVAKDVTEEWSGLAGDPTHTFSIDYIEVDSPASDISVLSNNSWTQVTNYGTWQNVVNKRATWLAVLQNPWTNADGSG